MVTRRLVMANKPKQVKRSWVVERKPFERDNSNADFYNSWAWRKFTKGFKDRHPLCEMYCKLNDIVSETTVVDHLNQFGLGVDGWDLNNLKDEYFQAGCDLCHNKRSGKQAHGYKGKL
jgi:hypothetical protein